MAKPEQQPTVVAYGMRDVGNGKWEAFRIRAPLTAIEPLSPVWREQTKEIRRHKSFIPDTRYPDDPTKLIEKEVVGEVPGKKWIEHRGERLHLAQERMLEAQHAEQVLGLPTKEERAKALAEARKRMAEINKRSA